VLPNYVLLPPSGVLLFVPDHTVEAFYMTKTWSWKPSFMNLNYENLREQR
jgi:ribosome biogenesis protein Tsr3